MLQTQCQSPAIMLECLPLTTRIDGARTLNLRRPGWLRVRRNRVWLTRPDSRADMVLDAGDSIFVDAGCGVVAEPWSRGATLDLEWSPAPEGAPGSTADERHV